MGEQYLNDKQVRRFMSPFILAALNARCAISTPRLNADLVFSMVCSKEAWKSVKDKNLIHADPPTARLLGRGWAMAKEKKG